VIRSVVARNAISALLFVVAVAGIIEKISEIHHGIIDVTTRIVLAAYILVALYALASIAVRASALRGKR
jgi:putative effector of murein hydrolase LrgA (UPF0299 family)